MWKVLLFFGFQLSFGYCAGNPTVSSVRLKLRPYSLQYRPEMNDKVWFVCLDENFMDSKLYYWSFKARWHGETKILPQNAKTFTFDNVTGASFLTVRNPSPDNVGIYICRVRGFDEIKARSILFPVQETHYKRSRDETFINSLPNMRIYLMELTENDPWFVCFSNPSTDSEKFQWTFQPRNSAETELPENVDTFSTAKLDGASFLKIKKPTIKNNGKYICRVGNSTATSLLFVRKGDMLNWKVLVSPRQLIYTIGQRRLNAKCTCRVENVYELVEKIYWKFKASENATEEDLPTNTEIPHNFRGKGIIVTSFLRIIKPTPQNTGFYICGIRGYKISDKCKLIVKE